MIRILHVHAQERLRREAAENEIKKLITQTRGVNLNSAQGSRAGGSKPPSKPSTAQGLTVQAVSAVQGPAEKKTVKFTPSAAGGGSSRR